MVVTEARMTDTTDRLYEHVLVLRCRAGDEAAFAELVERYQPRLRYYLRKMLRDLQEAEDALQDAWLAVFRALPRLSDLGAFRAWLYRIARDQALRRLRKRRPEYRCPEEVDSADGRAEEAQLASEAVECIHAALDELPAPQREVLVFRYVEDMSYEEIARVVGCPVGTVRSRLHHAGRALRAVLERMNLHD
jgi:RNA polymerase sigma-70 factor (ECF subfamily)